jgi:hypothetical protein
LQIARQGERSSPSSSFTRFSAILNPRQTMLTGVLERVTHFRCD